MVPKMFCLERFLYILSSSPLPLKLSKELFIFNLIYAREINQEKKTTPQKIPPYKRRRVLYMVNAKNQRKKKELEEIFKKMNCLN
jgi:asparagine synthetase B (glutamine-hydrolysing)